MAPGSEIHGRARRSPRRTAKRVASTSDRRIANNVMRHEYRVLTDNEKIDVKAIKDAGLEMFRHIETVASHYPKGTDLRNLEIAKQRLEEAVFWAVKHITQ